MLNRIRITKTLDWGVAMFTRGIAALWPRTVNPARVRRGLRRRIELARSRRTLHRPDERLLRDIGLTRHDAEAEASRAPWDPPLPWRD